MCEPAWCAFALRGWVPSVAGALVGEKLVDSWHKGEQSPAVGPSWETIGHIRTVAGIGNPTV